MPQAVASLRRATSDIDVGALWNKSGRTARATRGAAMAPMSAPESAIMTKAKCLFFASRIAEALMIEVMLRTKRTLGGSPTTHWPRGAERQRPVKPMAVNATLATSCLNEGREKSMTIAAKPKLLNGALVTVRLVRFGGERNHVFSAVEMLRTALGHLRSVKSDDLNLRRAANMNQDGACQPILAAVYGPIPEVQRWTSITKPRDHILTKPAINATAINIMVPSSAPKLNCLQRRSHLP